MFLARTIIIVRGKAENYHGKFSFYSNDKVHDIVRGWPRTSWEVSSHFHSNDKIILLTNRNMVFFEAEPRTESSSSHLRSNYKHLLTNIHLGLLFLILNS